MLKKLSPEQISKIMEKLPEDLKETFFSLETAEKISEVCERYEIPGDKISFVVNYVSQVLLGILSPEELVGLLEKEAGLKKDVALAVSQQIYRYIFFPVKNSLAEISGAIQVKPSAKEETKKEQTESKEERPTPSRPSGPDTYREPVE